MEKLIVDALAAGADVATISCGIMFIRHHTRLTKLETTLGLVVKSLKVSL